MRLRFKRFDDPRLARKFRILRVACALIGFSLLLLVLIAIASGELTVRGSRTGGRFVSDGVLRTIQWSDEPIIYLLIAVCYAGTSIALCAGLYLALAKVMESRHGRRRRFFQRKYPY